MTIASVAIDETSPWIVLLIEDEQRMRDDIVEEFNGEMLANRNVLIRSLDTFEEALSEVQEHRADLVILDVYKGNPLNGGIPLGLKVLDKIRATGFVSVVLYTANEDRVRMQEGPFIRVIGKHEGVAALRNEIERLFDGRMPQAFRAIVGHLDRTLRDYMWGFVTESWESLRTISDKPEFMRLLLRRLSASLGRDGVGEVIGEVFGGAAGEADMRTDKAHPAEFYVMPPVGEDILFGDVRVTGSGTGKHYWIVVWPSCDLVTTGGRVAKTDRIICLRATLFTEIPEVSSLRGAPADTKKQQRVTHVMMNSRKGDGISPERYHFLPGFLGVPDLLLDFQHAEVHARLEVEKWPCLATIASPFAELLSSRYLRYIGRLGVPDLDTDVVLQRMSP